MFQFKKILCPVDFDPNSLRALRLASELAQDRKATLHLLYGVAMTLGLEAALPFGRIGASAAFVRDGWTNLTVAMVLECAIVTSALIGAYLAGIVPNVVLELLFVLMMLQSVYFSLYKLEDDLVAVGEPLAQWLELMGGVPDETGKLVHYEVIHFWSGSMPIAGLMSGPLGIGSARSR